jgi:hypothetical protein
VTGLGGLEPEMHRGGAGLAGETENRPVRVRYRWDLGNPPANGSRGL